jgi:hypothetical protein
MVPKSCTQILTYLNKYNYIILLANRVYVLWRIICMQLLGGKKLCIIGAWRSLAARLLWEQEVGGSNPLAPTIIFFQKG